ncbi:MAG TPA: ribonuclease J [Bacilli bacterium]|nr:ribonuclease J [Bacilli bacterium]
MSVINIFALGGLNENGKNMYIVKVDKDIYVFDAGLMYADDTILGIDYIIPNFDYLKDNIKDIKGIFVTHAHEKNMGAICDIVSEIPSIKVYATKYTCEVLKKDLEESEIKFNNIIEIEPHKRITFGKNSIFPVRLTHSVPDAVGYALNTKDGTIFYTGNYLFDAKMPENYKTDVGKLAYIGKQGVLCLLSESMYAEKSGYTSPKQHIDELIRNTISKVNNRIIFALDTSQVSRIQELLGELNKVHRKVVIMGKKLQSTINYILDNNFIIFDKSKIGDLSNINDNDAIILIASEREKPYLNLSRIISGYDKYIKINETDTVFFLDPETENTEKIFIKVVDEISKIGANVVSLSRKDNLMYHASSEDIMLMLSLMNPKYFIPVMGEYRHQIACGKAAKLVGMSDQNILLRQNGEVVSFLSGKLVNEKQKVKVDNILIDGKSSQDIGELVLKDRELLSDNGIVIICASINRVTKEIMAGPEIITKGFIYVKENAELIEKIKEISKKTIIKNIGVLHTDFNKIKQGIRDELSSYLYLETECRPMIITVIQEI